MASRSQKGRRYNGHPVRTAIRIGPGTDDYEIEDEDGRGGREDHVGIGTGYGTLRGIVESERR